MTTSRRLAVALGLNVVIMVGQVVAGLLASSVGLLADAGHNLVDVAALILAMIAAAWSAKPPTESRSFGYHRATILAALANAAAILLATAVIVFEAIRHLLHPGHLHASTVIVVAVVSFLGNGFAALLLKERGHDLNLRAAFLHMAGDAAASFGVALAGLVVLLTGAWMWLDPAAALAIALLIAFQAAKLVGHSIEVLLESTPRDLDLPHLSETVEAVEGVDSMHDLHVWSLSSEVRALSVHLVLTGHPTLEEAQVTAEHVRQAIAVQFRIAHATLELECEPCTNDAATIDAQLWGSIEPRMGHQH